jgi:hypothetical protein
VKQNALIDPNFIQSFGNKKDTLPWNTNIIFQGESNLTLNLFKHALKNPSEEFNVHKFILIANSEVFSAMLRHKNTAEFREGRITIKDSNAIVVRHMINYMYTGQISDDFYLETDALPLFAIAHKYQIKPLMDFTEQLLIERFVLSHNGNMPEIINF